MHVIYSKNNATSLEISLTRKEYCLELAKALTAPAIALRKGPGRSPSSVLSHLTGKHFPYWSGVTERCAVCAYKKKLIEGHKGQRQEDYHMVP